ncbi:MAG: hypothetical protein RL514_3169 [Verrucomicrobiota bacterium]|jgi:hypothetical protein
MDKKTLTIAILAVLAIVGAAVRLATSQSDGTSRVNLKPFEQLGSMAAAEAAKALNSQGTVVVVVEVIEGVKNPANEAQVKGFKAGLGKSKGVTVKEVKELKRDMSGDPREWPAGQAAQIAGFGAGAGAVVLFINFPQSLSPADVATLKGSGAKLVVISGQSPLLASLVTQGIVRAAIVARTPPQPAPSGPESPAVWFERVYTVLRTP